MIWRIFLILFIFLSFILEAQKKSRQLDSLHVKFINDSAHCFRFKPVRPFFSLDNRHSFIKDAKVNVNGVQLGIILYDRHLVGYGLYGLQKSSRQGITSKNEKHIVAIRDLKLSYLTAFYQYTILNHRYLQLDLPLEIGLGSYQLNLLDTLTNAPIAPERKGGIVVTGGGASIILKPTKWLGLTGMAGYRGVLDGNANLNFNGAFYSYGIWLDLRQIYRDIKFYGFIRKKYNRKVKALG